MRNNWIERMHRGATLTLAALGILTLAGWAQPSWAGPAGPGNDIQAELERTDQVIQRAAEDLRDCTSIKGQALLEQSHSLQDKAWDFFRQGSGGSAGGANNAGILTRKARDAALEAIETCQVEFKAHEALRGVLDSTQDMAQDATAAVNASGNEDARRLLDAGLWQLDKAREAYRSEQYRKAITLSAAARNLVQRALQRSRADRPAGSASRVELALDRTDLLIGEVRASAGNQTDAKSDALLDGAQQIQDQARDLFSKGRYDLALRRSLKAREGALDALWLAQRAPDAQRVQQAIEMVNRLLQETGAEIREAGPEEAVRLLDAALDQMNSARQALKAGDAARAAQAVRLADSLLRRAADKSGRR